MYQLIPPFRYAIVEEGVYRGAYPSLKNFRFLRRLHLRTILSFIPHPPNDDLVDFCREENIEIYHFPCELFQDGVTLSSRQVAQAIQLIVNEDNLPLFIHCRDGGHVSGLVIMCLRKFQNWNLSVTFSEFTRFVKDNEISRDESQFVESFRAEIELPESTPSWFVAPSRSRVRASQLSSEGSPDAVRDHHLSPELNGVNHFEIDPDHASLSTALEALALEGLMLTTKRRTSSHAPVQFREALDTDTRLLDRKYHPLELLRDIDSPLVRPKFYDNHSNSLKDGSLLPDIVI
eukprot:TRINITY_DN4149_c0_g1::TRINITY_DN4149_c0_g1_i1::g.2040::m.2040 TRINITY_DN4149_c0_g1::TRINITY_DN4149_c0_g1_i1::g.2040  ORF type:complete len:311 (-),score=18.74,sp/Q1ZXG8/D1060_DICDI/33.75/1e-26,Y_phosphatase2/PF03162.8/9.3e-46,Y_phosphatase3/PF13350.1/0.18 TRINITY_DN4149_c0_g1_i1:352-1221(-)